ncbi:hypothetical protein EVAR_46564_1 [Eumeta japonica]|uniref:Uncharacterized protein n=1 Tax=Eumeta variegata TaxID=151549 RepID=A0A4C1XR10_EUMVA|nr:hypothetical protein EVAR_46564_1 [Eumeta japonica]
MYEPCGLAEGRVSRRAPKRVHEVRAGRAPVIVRAAANSRCARSFQEILVLTFNVSPGPDSDFELSRAPDSNPALTLAVGPGPGS